MRSRARVRHETRHPTRPQAPTPKEKQSPTIPDNPNDPYQLKPATNDGVSPTSLQGGVTNFLFNTLSIILPCTWVRPTPKSARVPAQGDLRTIPRRLPNRAEAPNRAKYGTPGHTQPPTPIKLLFDFSLIYTVLRKAGNQGEQESPFSSEALLPKHYPAPQRSQTGQKNARSRIHKRQGIKAAKS